MKPRVKHVGGDSPWAVLYGAAIISTSRRWRVALRRALVLAKDLARNGAVSGGAR